MDKKLDKKTDSNDIWFRIFNTTSILIISLIFGSVIFENFGVFLAIAIFNITSSPELQKNFIYEHLFHGTFSVIISIILIIWATSTLRVIIYILPKKDVRGKYIKDFFKAFKYSVSLFYICLAVMLGSNFLLNINSYGGHFSIKDNKIVNINMEEYFSEEKNKNPEKKNIYINSPLYKSILDVSLGFEEPTSAIEYGKKLYDLSDNNNLYENIKKLYSNNKIYYNGKFINKEEIIQLSVNRYIDNGKKPGNELWINCYSTEDLKSGNIIKIYDSEGEFNKEKNTPCSPKI